MDEKLIMQFTSGTDSTNGTLTARNDLTSFVPNLLLSELSYQLRMEPGVMPRPHSYEFRGACLLVDISGFTRLAGAHCAKGNDGIDSLQSTTSGFLGKLVRFVYLFGGDVIKFAGDALLCIFHPQIIPEHDEVVTAQDVDWCASKAHIRPASVIINSNLGDCDEEESFKLREPYLTSCACALRCAWELKQICTETLSIHVAVSCGTLCLGLLGGFENKWEFLVSGACLEKLAQCLEEAPSKNVVITCECYENVIELLRNSAPSSSLSSSPLSSRHGKFELGTLSSLQAEPLQSGNFRILCCRHPMPAKRNSEFAAAVREAHSDTLSDDGNKVSNDLSGHDDNECIRRLRLENRLLLTGKQGYLDATASLSIIQPTVDDDADVSCYRRHPSYRRMSFLPNRRKPSAQRNSFQASSITIDTIKVKQAVCDCRDARELLIDDENGDEDVSSSKRIDDDSTSMDLLCWVSCFVPLPVTQALLAGSIAFLSEVREVTTMFVKWDNYDHRKHADLLSLQDYLYASQEILVDTGGFLRQFLVDDKGCVFIALWGVPMATFPDNARRALWAAARISTKLQDMGMSTSIGITTGVVYCGTVGNSIRQEYAAVGDVVNLSARLMCKAHGGIMVDEATFTRLPRNLRSKLRRCEPMTVKGKDKPVTVYAYSCASIPEMESKEGIADKKTSGLPPLASEKGISHKLSIDRPMLTKDPSFEDDCLEIRQVCRDAFTLSLRRLLCEETTNNGKNSNKGDSTTTHIKYLPQIVLNSMSRFVVAQGNSISNSSMKGKGNDDKRNELMKMDFLVIEEPFGTSNAIAAEWLRRQCFANDLRVVVIRLSKFDAMTDYSAVSKLFRSLIREENIDNQQRQTFVVNSLLKETYPNDPETIRRVAFPTLQRTCGVTCQLPNKHEHSHYKRVDPESSHCTDSKLHGQSDLIFSSREHDTKRRTSTIHRDGAAFYEEHIDRRNHTFRRTSLQGILSHGERNGSKADLPAFSKNVGGLQCLTPLMAAPGLSRPASLSDMMMMDAGENNMGDTDRLDARLITPETPIYSNKTKAAEALPTRLMINCIQDVFTTLLREQPVVVIIEEAHEIDEASWNALLSIADIDAKATIVLFQKPPSSLVSIVCGDNGDLADGDDIAEPYCTPDDVVGVSYEWIESYLNRLMLANKSAKRITIPDYTLSEARTYLLNHLNIPSGKLPPGFDTKFYNLTAHGNIFWVHEITSFIQTYGIGEFLQIVGNGSLTNGFKSYYISGAVRPQGKSDGCSPHGAMTTIEEEDDDIGGILNFAKRKHKLLKPMFERIHDEGFTMRRVFSTVRRTNSNISRKPVIRHIAVLSANAAAASPVASSNGSESHALDSNAAPKSSAPKFGRSWLRRHLHVDPTSRLEPTAKRIQSKPPAQSKLEQIVVCQFSKLSPDEQCTARTAAIVGMSFTFDVLSAVLDDRLRPYLPALLKSLLDKHWLRVSTEVQSVSRRRVKKNGMTTLGGKGRTDLYILSKSYGAIVTSSSDKEPNREETSSKSQLLGFMKYSFVHPLLHKTLYNLTPASTRATIHSAIATFMEQQHLGDKHFFPKLAYHFANADPMYSKKSAEYIIKTVRDMLSLSRCNFDGVILLLYAAADMSPHQTQVLELLDLIKACREKYELHRQAKGNEELHNAPMFNSDPSSIPTHRISGTFNSFRTRLPSFDFMRLLSQRRVRRVLAVQSGKSSRRLLLVPEHQLDDLSDVHLMRLTRLEKKLTMLNATLRALSSSTDVSRPGQPNNVNKNHASSSSGGKVEGIFSKSEFSNLSH